MTIHAHVDTYTTDCDGGISRTYVMTMNDDELAEAEKAQGVNDFSEIHFRDRVLCHIVSAYTAWDGTLKVIGDEPDGLTERLTWSERTDEGVRHAEAVFCTDDCEDEKSTYRDHRAESLGY